MQLILTLIVQFIALIFGAAFITRMAAEQHQFNGAPHPWHPRRWIVDRILIAYFFESFPKSIVRDDCTYAQVPRASCLVHLAHCASCSKGKICNACRFSLQRGSLHRCPLCSHTLHPPATLLVKTQHNAHTGRTFQNRHHQQRH
jgi:hypothetical protein